MVRIRSQDGKIFIDTDMLYVYNEMLWACIGSDWDRGARLVGVFPTQERAIAELNKIQRLVDEGQPNPIYQVTKPQPDNQKGEPEPC